MALRGVVVFPDEPLHFDVGRDRSILSLKNAVEGDRRIFLVTQREVEVDNPKTKDLYKVGVIATVEQMLKGSDNTIRVLVNGVMKARLLEFYEDDCMMAVVEPLF